MVALAELALQPEGTRMSLTDLSERQKISLPYLEQLFVKLRRAELVESVRGPGGGYMLARPSSEIRVAEILAAEHRNAPFSCVMHCFSSGAALAKRALDLGFYLSMSGITAFPKSAELRDIFAGAPLDRILVETDAPYLAPPPHRGKRNEPAYTAHTARKAAETFGLDYGEFAARTEANFERLFTKAAAWSPS